MQKNVTSGKEKNQGSDCRLNSDGTVICNETKPYSCIRGFEKQTKNTKREDGLVAQRPLSIGLVTFTDGTQYT